MFVNVILTDMGLVHVNKLDLSRHETNHDKLAVFADFSEQLY